MICLWQWKYFFILLPNFFHNSVFCDSAAGCFCWPRNQTILQSPNLTQWLTHLRNSFVLTKWHDWQSETPIFSSEKTTIDGSSSPFFSTRDRKLHFVQNFFHTVRKDLNLANKKFVITHTSRISIENWVECWKSQKSGLTYVNSCICFIFIYRNFIEL